MFTYVKMDVMASLKMHIIWPTEVKTKVSH